MVKISTLTKDSLGAFLKLTEFDKVTHPQLVENITSRNMPNSCLKNCGIYVTILPQPKVHIYYKEKLVTR